MSHRSSELKMYTQQIICARIAFRATAGTAHERTPRTSHNPQSLSAFTYRPPAQQLTKHATTNLLTYPILVRYDTVVFDYSTTDGTAHLPRVLRPLPTASFTHSALVQSYLHTTGKTRGPTPLAGPRNRQHALGTSTRTHSSPSRDHSHQPARIH